VNRRSDWSSKRGSRIIVANSWQGIRVRWPRDYSTCSHVECTSFRPRKESWVPIVGRTQFPAAVTSRVSKVRRGNLKFLEINLSEVFKAVFLSRSSSSSFSFPSYPFFIYDSHKSTWIAGDSRNFHDTAGGSTNSLLLGAVSVVSWERQRERERERGGEGGGRNRGSRNPDINRRGSNSRRSLYVIAFITNTWSEFKSRCPRRHTLHIRERCVMWYVRTYITRRAVCNAKTYNEISPACRKFPASADYLQIVRATRRVATADSLRCSPV